MFVIGHGLICGAAAAAVSGVVVVLVARASENGGKLTTKIWRETRGVGINHPYHAPCLIDMDMAIRNTIFSIQSIS